MLGDVGNSAQGTVKKRPALPTYFTKIESEKFIWMLQHYFDNFIDTLKYKHHSAPSLHSCLFIWDKDTTVDTRTDQEPSIYVI